GQLAFLAVDADALQLYLAAGVAGLLGLLECLQRLVELMPRRQGPPEVEARQGRFTLPQVFDCFTGVAQEEEGDPEFEVPALGRRSGRAFEPLVQDVRDIPEGPVLGPPLSQALPNLLHSSRVTILALDQYRFQINQHRLDHAAPSGTTPPRTGGKLCLP